MKQKRTFPAKPKELRVSCRVTPEIVDGIAVAAKTIGVSDSDVVRMAIKKFLPTVGQPEKQAA